MILVCIVGSECPLINGLLYFRKNIMPSCSSNKHNTQAENVHPTRRMRTQNRAHSPKFVIVLGVPPI